MTSLTVRELQGGYVNAESIVKGIDLSVEAADLAIVIGPNGAGKSTVLRLIAGLLPKRTGEVLLGDEPLPAGNAQWASRKGLGFVPQERNVFASLTVHENLEMGGYLQPKAVKRGIEEQVARFPVLKTKLRERAGYLSGGQRQVLALAIVLMTSPSVLLLDEPTAGLSPVAADEIFALVRQLASNGLAVLMVEQNALLALEHGTRGIVLVAGRKVRDTAAKTLLGDEEVRHLFLGRTASATQLKRSS